jgi:multidrug efflux pump subunit AcrA (membrane-fusion protein)
MIEEQVTEQAEPGTEATGEGPELQAQDEPEQPKKLEITQAELDAIVQKAKAKEARAVMRRLQNQQPAQPEARQPAPQAEPRRTDYADDAQWIDAKIEYREQQRDMARRDTEQARAQEQTRAKAIDLYDAAEELPEFDREVFDTLTVTDVMGDAIMDMDMAEAAKVMAYMSAHPDEVDGMHKLSAVRQANAIFKLADRIADKPKKNLPNPPDRVGGTTAPMVDDIMKMSPEQYKAYRAKQGAWWAK